jgi:hypothetical protein
MLVIRLMVLLIGVLAGTAQASERQIWACKTEHTNAQPILYLVEWGSRSYVRFTHMRFAARYENGDDRHGWYWSNEGNGYYRYALLLEPDGRAWLHDFDHTDDDGLSAPMDSFRCSSVG